MMIGDMLLELWEAAPLLRVDDNSIAKWMSSSLLSPWAHQRGPGGSLVCGSVTDPHCLCGLVGTEKAGRSVN